MMFYSFHVIALLCFAITLKITATLEDKVLRGTFWHITDFHYDKNYSRTGDPNNMCHDGEKNLDDTGYFGNFLCDSPENLVNLTVKNMKILSNHSKPDFIIWTGDNAPHTRPNPMWDDIFQAIGYLTTLLKETFDGVKIFPSIGNHDSHPPNILLPSDGNSSVYDDYLEKALWNTILPKSTWDTFKRGGFYSYIYNKLRIISLNTILWYETNSLVKNLTDPAGQLKWFEDELENASFYKEQVYIIGHVPPGFYNRIIPGKLSTPTFHPQYLKKYLKIVKEHASIISGQMFGHIHNDMFQLHACNTGAVLSSSLLASSVTPWHTTHDKFDISLPVNPSIRLMMFDKKNYSLLDYKQYFLNLTLANMKAEELPYELLYTFSKTYNVRDLSTKSLEIVFEKLKNNKSEFSKFFKYLTSGKITVDCDDACHTAQICSMSCTSEEEYTACMHKTVIDDDTSVKPISHSEVVAYAVGIPVIIILVIVVLIIYKKKKTLCRNRNTYRDFSDI